MATSALTSPQTVKNCIGWIFSPLPQVGSPVGNLKTTPTGLDSATKIGCKSQSFTSWDCVSRLYVGGVLIAEQPTSDAPTRVRRDTTIVGDTPTEEEAAQFLPAQKILLDKKLKIFVRGHGVLTQSQAAKLHLDAASQTTAPIASRAKATGSKPQTANEAKVAAQIAKMAGTSVQTRSMADDNTGYYYSDILPVRSVAVSTMTALRETDPMPYSPQYQILAGRLNDPAQTGVLSAVVRGPNVRDATTMSSLVKALALRPSTRYEIAAMLRCGCMGLSVGEESYFTDPIPHRFVRKPTSVSGSGMDILQKPGVNAASWKSVAMPLDTFVALANNSYYSHTPEDFTYGGLDVTWTAVPVPSRLLGQSHLLAYIMSFLSSDSWSGTVNYKTTTERKGPEAKDYLMNETYIPTVNSVDIPGVRNVCLVLIDETSPNCPADIRLAMRDVSATIPVWRGTNEVAPVSIWPLWEKFWSRINIPGIRRDTALAFSEICTRLGVSDACGTALAILAELYGQWYGGMAPPISGNKPTPDFGQAAYGAWTYDGSALDKTGQMKSHLFNLNQADKVDARRRTIAYNFSGISPLHVFPTGLVRMRYMGVEGALRMSWSTQQPEVSIPTYNVQTMTSVSRVATAMGLIMTHTQSYRFASPTGFVHWIHMLSCAISFSSSAFLTINDITPRDWAGIYNKYDVAHRDLVLDTLKTSIYSGILVHHDIENLFSNISEWDLDIMADYWLVSPYSNVNWLTFSPVPSHCTQQWIDKMGLAGGMVPKGTTTFNYRQMTYMAMKVMRDHNEHKFNMMATIDMYRRFPQALVREPGSGYECVLHWVENVAGYSNAACSEHRILSPADMYESLTFCASTNNIGIPYSDPTEWYIIGSNYEYGDPSLSVLKTTPIQWPDPPILDTLWQGAKNYILKPAASALAGFLTGGPAGAAVAGATHIAHQLVTDLASTKESPRAAEAVTRAEETAKRVLGLSPGSTKVTTEKTIKSTSAANPTTRVAGETESPVVKGAKVAALMESERGGSKKDESVVSPAPVPEPMKALQTPDESPVNE